MMSQNRGGYRSNGDPRGVYPTILWGIISLNLTHQASQLSVRIISYIPGIFHSPLSTLTSVQCGLEVEKGHGRFSGSRG